MPIDRAQARSGRTAFEQCADGDRAGCDELTGRSIDLTDDHRAANLHGDVLDDDGCALRIRVYRAEGAQLATAHPGRHGDGELRREHLPAVLRPLIEP